MEARGASLVPGLAAGASGVWATGASRQRQKAAEQGNASLNPNFIGLISGASPRMRRCSQWVRPAWKPEPPRPTGARHWNRRAWIAAKSLRRGSQLDPIDRHGDALRPHPSVTWSRSPEKTANFQDSPPLIRTAWKSPTIRKSSCCSRPASKLPGNKIRLPRSRAALPGSLASQHRASGRRQDRDGGRRRGRCHWRDGSRRASRLPECRNRHKRRQHPYVD